MVCARMDQAFDEILRLRRASASYVLTGHHFGGASRLKQSLGHGVTAGSWPCAAPVSRRVTPVGWIPPDLAQAEEGGPGADSTAACSRATARHRVTPARGPDCYTK